MSHRLQQSLHLVELLLTHPRLHLDLTDDPLKSLQPALGEERGLKVKKHFQQDKVPDSQVFSPGYFYALSVVMN